MKNRVVHWCTCQLLTTECRRLAQNALAVIFISGCAALSGIPALDSAEGQIYRKRCIGCHGIPDPRFRTFEEWQRIVPDMERRISDKGLPPISTQDRKAILEYLRRYAEVGSTNRD